MIGIENTRKATMIKTWEGFQGVKFKTLSLFVLNKGALIRLLKGPHEPLTTRILEPY